MAILTYDKQTMEINKEHYGFDSIYSPLGPQPPVLVGLYNQLLASPVELHFRQSSRPLPPQVAHFSNGFPVNSPPVKKPCSLSLSQDEHP